MTSQSARPGNVNKHTCVRLKQLWLWYSIPMIGAIHWLSDISYPINGHVFSLTTIMWVQVNL